MARPVGSGRGPEPELSAVQEAVDRPGHGAAIARGRDNHEDVHAMQPPNQLLCGEAHLLGVNGR